MNGNLLINVHSFDSQCQAITQSSMCLYCSLWRISGWGGKDASFRGIALSSSGRWYLIIMVGWCETVFGCEASACPVVGGKGKGMDASVSWRRGENGHKTPMSPILPVRSRCDVSSWREGSPEWSCCYRNQTTRVACGTWWWTSVESLLILCPPGIWHKIIKN